MSLLRRNLNGGVRGSLAGVFTVCLVFGLSVRTGVEQSFINHCLSVISDHYYLLYFMLPLFLLMCFFIIEDDSEVVIMRYKSYFRYFISKWFSLVVITLIFMAVQFTAIIISGLGLPSEGDWTIVNGSTTQELFTVLSSYFTSPLLSLAAISAYMFAGLCITAMILMWVSHFISKLWSTKVMIILYLLSVLSMRIGFIRDLPITMLNHLVILHHNLSAPYRLTLTATTAIVIICVILLTVRKYWNQQLFPVKKQVIGITPYYCMELISRKNVVIMVAVVVLMVVWKYLQSAGDIDGTEWIIRLFAGHGTGSFHMLGFIEMLLLNGTPIYLLSVFIEKVTTEHSSFVTIRLRKRRDILDGILTSAMLFVLLYGLIMISIPALALLISGFPVGSSTLTLLSQSVIMRLLDVTLQALFITIVYCLTGQTISGFVGIIALNLLCIAPLGFIKYLPFGLSSLLRINLRNVPEMVQIGMDGIAGFSAALILLISSIAITSWLYITGYKRLPKN